MVNEVESIKTYVTAANDLALDYRTTFSRMWKDKERKGFSQSRVPRNFYSKFRTNLLSEANAITDAVDS